ncbi:MAG: hypothetical protein KFW09_04190 [Oscillospiraceae bacterium]|nr:hypothetical protein [Oscillospiraceae bacterium]
MKKYNDIEIYRKKRNKKKNIKFFLFLILMIIVIFIIYYLSSYLSGNNSNFFETNKFLNGSFFSNKVEFPINLNQNTYKDIDNINNNISVTNQKSVEIYGFNGNPKFAFEHGLENPILRYSNKKGVVFDFYGENFKIFSSSKVLFEKKLNERIIDIQIFNNGYVGIIVKSDKYFGTVIIFNAKNEEIFRWNSVDGYINTIDFKKNILYISTYNISDSVYNSYITEVQINQNKQIKKVSFPDSMIINFNIKQNGNIVCIFDNKSSIVTSNGSKGNNYLYKKNISNFYNIGNNKYLLYFNDGNNINNNIILLDNANNIKAEYSTNVEVKKMEIEDQNITLLLNNKVLSFNSSLKFKKEIDIPDATIDFFSYKGIAYVLTDSYIHKINLN